jgi:hypothetical protein
LFYATSRGRPGSRVALIVNGFAREVLKQLPMEFAVEAQKLLGISLEGSVDDHDFAHCGCIGDSPVTAGFSPMRTWARKLMVGGLASVQLFT